MYNPESVLENETHKIFWAFVIQTDHLISTRRPDLSIVNKKKKKRNFQIVDFAVSPDHKVKLKESEKRDNYLDLTRELKKTKEHESEGDISCNWRSLFSHQRIGTGTGGFGNKRTSGNHQNYIIVEIGQNTKKCPWDLRRLAVIQTPGEKPSASAGRKNSQLSKILIDHQKLVQQKYEGRQ